MLAGLIWAALVLAAPPATVAPAAAVVYRAPVDGPVRVLFPFVAPVFAYGPGHRGVDLATRTAQQVVAPAPAVVTFAGDVAGRGVVVLRHGDGVSTEYEPVVPLVQAGTVVTSGEVIATVAGSHNSCSPGACLHWAAWRGGARRGRDYFDPMTLLQPLGPVVLLPLSS